ncbi:MAG: YihA family ribosome biogenesis GTP-binding protein [Nitrosomonas sp.]|uniref:ribosome biogenesis GTP-binding protein YihA/YsxC n=1 Tax=Nitrosomonas sp. TaxID=42353 RepID=UPI0032EB614B
MHLFQKATFYTSINDMHALPQHTGIEIAFAGRSNAGKSSVINTLANKNRLAFVSKTPGRTQHINFFQLNESKFLVDLPGYGYAKVPDNIRKHWEELLSQYLQTRESLKGLVLIMDIRHPFKALDIQMLDWFIPTGKTVHIILTKADKLSKQQANITLQHATQYLQESYPGCSVQLFSSLARSGIEDATSVINSWLSAD